MTKQRINLRLESADLTSAMPDLAVEVHDDNLSLATRGTLEKGVELETNHHYFISATLSDGRRVSTFAEVVPGTTELVLPVPKYGTSTPASESGLIADTPSTVGHESTAASIATKTTKAPAGRSRGATEPSWRVTGFRGNLLTGEPRYFELQRSELSAPLPSGFASVAEVLGVWSIPFNTQPTFVQFAQRGRPTLNYAVPIGPGENCVARLLRWAGSDPLTVDIRLPNKNADLMLRYVGNNLMQEVKQSAGSVGILAQDLVSSKFESPIGAVVGAYALLRLGQLDRLDDWTQNLCNIFGWLPDGVVIRAEHLARIGKHQEALSTLTLLSGRGLPFFVAGLTYAVNRLRQYQGPVQNKKLTCDVGAVEKLRTVLERYSGLLDVTCPILTFVGRDPINPSRKPGGLPKS